MFVTCTSKHVLRIIRPSSVRSSKFLLSTKWRPLIIFKASIFSISCVQKTTIHLKKIQFNFLKEGRNVMIVVTYHFFRNKMHNISIKNYNLSVITKLTIRIFTHFFGKFNFYTY